MFFKRFFLSPVADISKKSKSFFFLRSSLKFPQLFIISVTEQSGLANSGLSDCTNPNPILYFTVKLGSQRLNFSPNIPLPTFSIKSPPALLAIFPKYVPQPSVINNGA